MNNDNRHIHALWIGQELSLIELLCINSFINNGHQFHLWTYNTIKTPLPKHIIVEDAAQIIPKSEVFCYKHTNQFGHGKGSYAGFSDIFRYKLLYEKGGWWTDMDVVCLKPLDFPEAYVFRTHHDFPVIGNMMKCPPRSKLMNDCYRIAKAQVDENNTDWNLPIKILNKCIADEHLSGYVKSFTNDDRWRDVKKLIVFNFSPPKHWYAVHLLNEEWRKNKIDKNNIPKHSFIGRKIALFVPDFLSKKTPLKVFSNYLKVLSPDNSGNAKAFFFELKWLVSDMFWKTLRFIQRKGFNIDKTNL